MSDEVKDSIELPGANARSFAGELVRHYAYCHLTAEMRRNPDGETAEDLEELSELEKVATHSYNASLLLTSALCGLEAEDIDALISETIVLASMDPDSEPVEEASLLSEIEDEDVQQTMRDLKSLVDRVTPMVTESLGLMTRDALIAGLE